MNYKKIYDQLIESRKKLNRSKLKRNDPNYIYFESHHIIPRSCGGTNEKENLVLLTAKEHFLAHMLLIECYSCKERQSMIHALWKMCQMSKFTHGRLISIKQFEYAKQAYSKMLSIKNTGKTNIDKFGEEKAKLISNKKSKSRKQTQEKKEKNPEWIKEKEQKKENKKNYEKIKRKILKDEKIKKGKSYKPSLETKKKMSDARKKKWENITIEEKEKIIKKRLEKLKNLPEEDKIIATEKRKHLWKTMSDAKKKSRNENISLSLKGKPSINKGKKYIITQEEKQRRRLTKLNNGTLNMSQTVKEKISRTHKKRILNMSQDEIEILKQNGRAYWENMSIEDKQKHSEGVKKYFENMPVEKKEKRNASIKLAYANMSEEKKKERSEKIKASIAKKKKQNNGEPILNWDFNSKASNENNSSEN